MTNLRTVSKEAFHKRRLIFHIFLICLSISLAILIFFAKQDAYFPFDLQITLAIQGFHAIWFDTLMRSLSFIGEPVQGVILTAALAGLLFKLNQKKDAGLLVFSVVGAEVITLILKTIVSRKRPDPHLVHQVYQTFRTDSFPSGHVLFYLSFFGFLFFLTYSYLHRTYQRTFLLFTFSLLILLIGPSRIYLGAHWFSDVLGAFLIGTLWLTFMVHLHRIFVPTQRS